MGGALPTGYKIGLGYLSHHNMVAFVAYLTRAPIRDWNKSYRWSCVNIDTRAGLCKVSPQSATYYCTQL